MANFLWIIGVGITAFDTFIGTIGKIMMKLSHNLDYTKAKKKYFFVILIDHGLYS